MKRKNEPSQNLSLWANLTDRLLRIEREVVEAAEHERRRLGHELHDDLGQRMTAISLQADLLGSMLKDEPEAVPALLTDLKRMVRDAAHNARMLSHGFACAEPGNGDVIAAINALAENTALMFGVLCCCECAEPIALRNPKAALELYRIAQEAITNARKHGQATQITISLQRTCESRATLVIGDNGKGISNQRTASPGMGLRIMEYRAACIGGMLMIRPRQRGGTEVACVFPCKRAEARLVVGSKEFSSRPQLEETAIRSHIRLPGDLQTPAAALAN